MDAASMAGIVGGWASSEVLAAIVDVAAAQGALIGSAIWLFAAAVALAAWRRFGGAPDLARRRAHSLIWGRPEENFCSACVPALLAGAVLTSAVLCDQSRHDERHSRACGCSPLRLRGALGEHGDDRHNRAAPVCAIMERACSSLLGIDRRSRLPAACGIRPCSAWDSAFLHILFGILIGHAQTHGN